MRAQEKLKIDGALAPCPPDLTEVTAAQGETATGKGAKLDGALPSKNGAFGVEIGALALWVRVCGGKMTVQIRRKMVPECTKCARRDVGAGS